MEWSVAVGRPLLRALLFALLIGVVAGCGGGGGGGGGNGDDTGGDTGGDTATFSVSGTATVAGSTASDSDTNEANAPASPNDTFPEAQSIINPVTLGGYANVAGQGPEGRSFESGDVSDLYHVNLVDGQSLTLTISDTAVSTNGDDPFSGGDLDLYLFPGSCDDGSCSPSACDYNEPKETFGWEQRSAETGETESLSVNGDGDYYLEVCSFYGGSNYTLSIGRGGASTTAAADGSASAGMDDDFVPGDIIVRFHDHTVNASGGTGLYNRAAALGMTPKAGGEGRPMLMGLGGGDRVATLSALGVDVAGSEKRAHVARQGEEALLKWDTLRAIEAIEQRADVAYAEPNRIVQPFKTPTDQFYDLQWHYPAINLPQAWDITTGMSDPDVVVAVIDTGIRDDHPDFTGQFVPGAGYDLISDPAIADDGDGIDPDPHDPGDGSGSRPSSWHGTHVAGTVAARTNDGDRTVAGVAWNAKLMNLRALGVGGGTTYDVNQAIYYAAGLENDSPTTADTPADVINMSLGGSTPTDSQREAVRAARAEGAIIVAAAGNAGTSELQYPASYDGVISVSAVDINRDFAPYSSFGTEIDVAAPGGDTGADVNGDGNPDGILSTLWDEGGDRPTYGFYQGTSMAAPHVAGVIALMKAVNPALTPDDIDRLLQDGRLTDDLGDTGRDNEFGHGLINAYRAVDTARDDAGGGDEPEQPSLTLNPGSLNFGATGTRIEVTADNGGGGTLTGVQATADGAAWLDVEAVSTDDEGLGTWAVTVDRDGLADATYSGQVDFTSDAGPVTLPVVMTVRSGDATAEAGRHFMLLIDADTGETLDQDVVDPANGEYGYEFTDVAPGDYQVIGGTDFDNDGFICDPGEACGGYGSFDDLRTVTVVDTDLTGLDFNTGFPVALQASGASLDGPAASDRGFRRLREKEVAGDE